MIPQSLSSHPSYSNQNGYRRSDSAEHFWKAHWAADLSIGIDSLSDWESTHLRYYHERETETETNELTLQDAIDESDSEFVDDSDYESEFLSDSVTGDSATFSGIHRR